ncbi:hypothetical protein LCGC14_1333160 [marine sediment metagenome]|uniref:Uncharacterized protein n=1 Tax=marine sediment metagenome TaxID=412755 RepID=A0A0F9L1Y9_9ZZZZ
MYGLTRERWNERNEMSIGIAGAYPCPTKKQNIETLVSSLIASVYEPDAEIGWIADPRKYKFGNETINWGDLSVVSVDEDGDRFTVNIEEAAPGCELFQSWIEGWLSRWGWDCEAVTEW